METLVLLFVIAVLLVLIPFVPPLLRFRIRVFRWLHWNRLADLIEKDFDGWVILIRVLLVSVACVFAYFGLMQLK